MQLLLAERAEEQQRKLKQTPREETENLEVVPRRSPQIGDRFGKLRVIEISHYGRNRCRVKCQCDCGKTRILPSSFLYYKQPKYAACNINGCKQGKLPKHGFARTGTRTTEYIIWRGMIQRCYDKNAINFHTYGGQGITVCDEWRHDFPAFFRDMGSRPSKKHSIDRIDNKNGYFKDNCRWATSQEQSSNTRRNVFLTFNGETHTIWQWAAKIGLKPMTLHNRVRRGWSIEDCLTKPLRTYP